MSRYLNGEGVPRDVNRAVELFRNAAAMVGVIHLICWSYFTYSLCSYLCICFIQIWIVALNH